MICRLSGQTSAIDLVAVSLTLTYFCIWSSELLCGLCRQEPEAVQRQRHCEFTYFILFVSMHIV